MLYNNLSGYFRQKYGKRLTKICIDGAFSCPNRDGKCGFGGCIFCGERGAGEHIEPATSIREQVSRAIDGASPDSLFCAYFQNFTNTYDTPENLKKKYDAALIDERIRVLAIGTRPDCIDEEIASLIASYKKNFEVWVELGLQTANDETALIINRGYKTEVFTRAVEILKKYGIPVVAHLIVGLPGEDIEDVKKSVKYINGLDIWGIKIHSIYVMRGTRLAEMYERGEYTPPTLSEYIEAAVHIVSHISPDMIIHRLTGDCPQGLLIAPDWNSDKNALIAEINRSLEANGLCQGKKYKKEI
jgi:radical SAM protein (TIGR01212 family)